MIIAEEVKDVKVSGATTQGFTILATSKAFQILSSNIYTNKIRAIIREISTNAWDAHVDAGNNNMFDVHLPTSFEPWFSVRDYGKGLSHEDMCGLYTQFFNSTRTQSDAFCGALGIGRMAPLSKIDSFTVRSFKDGFVRTYTIYKNEQGLPNIAHLSEEPTVEPTGLNVFVNVEKEDIEEYKQQAVNVFKYFKKVPNINIKDIKVAIEEYHNSMRVNSDEVRSTLKSGSVVAVMGNVAYNVPSEYTNRRNLHAELHFPIGAISFDPGRENLSLDKKTIAAITEATKRLSSNIASYLEKDIEDQPTNFDKYLRAFTYIQNYDGAVLKHIESLLLKYEPKCDNHNVYSRGYRSVEHYIKKDVVFVDSKSEYYLHKDKMSARIKQYVKETGKTVVVLTQEQIDKAGIPADLVKDLETLPKVIRAKSTVKRGSIYTINHGGTYSNKIDFVGTLPTEEKIYFTADHGHYDKNSINAAKALGLIKNTDVLYVVTKAYSKKKSFAKNNWIEFSDYIKKHSAQFATMEFEDVSNVGDTNMIEVGRMSKAPPKYKQLSREFDKICQNPQFKHLDLLKIPYVKLYNIKKECEDFGKKYPLLIYTHIYRASEAEVLHYIQVIDKLEELSAQNV